MVVAIGHRPLFLRHWKSMFFEIANDCACVRRSGASAAVPGFARTDARNETA